jgi:hypothetical protein
VAYDACDAVSYSHKSNLANSNIVGPFSRLSIRNIMITNDTDTEQRGSYKTFISCIGSTPSFWGGFCVVNSHPKREVLIVNIR